MNEILTKTFYDNTVQQWLIAGGIIIVALMIGKIVYWVSGRYIKKLTSKTKTKLDDILIDMFEEPVVVIIMTAGTWFAIKTLTFSDKVSMTLSHIFQAVIILTVAWLIVRFFDALCEEYIVPLTEKTDTDLDDQLLPIIRKGSKFVVWSIALIVALNNAGYNVGALIAGLGIGGIALAMAAKDSISNIFGGLTIYTDRPFRMKDRIQINGFDGKVTEIGLRSTKIQTLKGRIVTIPNAKFAETEIENVSKEPTRKITVNLGLTYNTPPEKMKEALKILGTIVKGNKNITGKHVASFNSFGDFYLGIKFIYFIKKTDDEAAILKIESDISLAILEQFNKNQLEFAFPTQTIFHQKM